MHEDNAGQYMHMQLCVVTHLMTHFTLDMLASRQADTVQC